DGRRCGYCGGPATTIDHILPRSRGGKNHWLNTVAACCGCNQRKGDRTPAEAGLRLRFEPPTPTSASPGTRRGTRARALAHSAPGDLRLEPCGAAEPAASHASMITATMASPPTPGASPVTDEFAAFHAVAFAPLCTQLCLYTGETVRARAIADQAFARALI